MAVLFPAFTCVQLPSPKKKKHLSDNMNNFTYLSHKLTDLSEDCPTLKQVIATTDQSTEEFCQ